MKANPVAGIVSEVAAAGFGISAVSRGELAIASGAGVPAEETALEGIGKTSADLAEAARLAAAGTPLLWVSLESADDAAALAALDTPMDVLVRVNPGVAPETHAGLAVGAPES
jgi:diaminopimelate decarboxylase